MARHDYQTASLITRPGARRPPSEPNMTSTPPKADWDAVVPVALRRLNREATTIEQRLHRNLRLQAERDQWLHDHPDKARHIANLKRQLLPIDHPDSAYLLDRLDTIPVDRTPGHGRSIKPPALKL